MIIDPFLNNPKKLDYQLSNSIYKPKTKKNETKKKLEMNKKQAVNNFKEYYYPALNTFKWSTGDEQVPRHEAWIDYMANLLRNKKVTLQEYFEWSNPFI